MFKDDMGIYLIIFGLFLIFGAEVCYAPSPVEQIEEQVKTRIRNPSTVILLPNDPNDPWK